MPRGLAARGSTKRGAHTSFISMLIHPACTVLTKHQADSRVTMTGHTGSGSLCKVFMKHSFVAGFLAHVLLVFVMQCSMLRDCFDALLGLF